MTNGDASTGTFPNVEVHNPNWKPLASHLGEKNIRMCDWMWMYRKDGIEYYKHSVTRKYLALDDGGHCWMNGWMRVDFWKAYRKACSME